MRHDDEIMITPTNASLGRLDPGRLAVLTILGSAIKPFTALRAVALLNQLPLDELRIQTFPLEDAAAAIEAVRSGKYDKVQLVPSFKDAS